MNENDEVSSKADDCELALGDVWHNFTFNSDDEKQSSEPMNRISHVRGFIGSNWPEFLESRRMNFAGLLLGPAWFFYRKMHIAASASFLSLIVLFLFRIPTEITAACWILLFLFSFSFGRPLYVRHVHRVIDILTREARPDLEEAIMRAGGVSVSGLYVGLLINVIFAMSAAKLFFGDSSMVSPIIDTVIGR